MDLTQLLAGDSLVSSLGTGLGALDGAPLISGWGAERVTLWTPLVCIVGIGWVGYWSELPIL